MARQIIVSTVMAVWRVADVDRAATGGSRRCVQACCSVLGMEHVLQETHQQIGSPQTVVRLPLQTETPRLEHLAGSDVTISKRQG